MLIFSGLLSTLASSPQKPSNIEATSQLQMNPSMRNQKKTSIGESTIHWFVDQPMKASIHRMPGDRGHGRVGPTYWFEDVEEWTITQELI